MSKRKANNYHAELHSADTESETVGCRHTNADICARNQMPGVCAFVRLDNVCKSPPASWPRQFKKLASEATGEVDYK